MAMPSCCIVIPIYKFQHSKEECQSVERAIDRLSVYPIRFVAKNSLVDSHSLHRWCSSPKHKDVKVISIADQFMSSIQAYNEMMLSSWFYELFSNWDYILIHQVDARIINESRLEDLLNHHYSYVGGPFVHPSNSRILPLKRYPRIYGGNGGLSLRLVRHFIRLFDQPRFYHAPVRGVRDSFSYLLMRHCVELSTPPSWADLFGICLKSLRMALGYKNTLMTMEKTSTCQEDFIYSVFCSRQFSWFRVAPASIASHYMLDSYPEFFCGWVDHDQLLGCHGWEKNGKSFWSSRLPAIFAQYHP